MSNIGRGRRWILFLLLAATVFPSAWATEFRFKTAVDEVDIDVYDLASESFIGSYKSRKSNRVDLTESPAGRLFLFQASHRKPLFVFGDRYRGEGLEFEPQERMPWLRADYSKGSLIDEQGHRVKLSAHGGLTYELPGDLLAIKRMRMFGMNANRLVFRSFDNKTGGKPGLYLRVGEPFNPVISGFTDEYIEKYLVAKVELAKSLGMYTILDHHDMFLGGKNMMNEYEKSSDVYHAWLDMWERLAIRFKDEPAIAMYEVENEPGAKLSPKFVVAMHNEVIARIRRHDRKHVIAFGHGWGNAAQETYLKYGIPSDPENNLIYSVHHYYKPFLSGGLADKLEGAHAISAKYHVLYWMGEFGYEERFGRGSVDLLSDIFAAADQGFLSTVIWREADILDLKRNIDATWRDELALKKRIYVAKSSQRLLSTHFDVGSGNFMGRFETQSASDCQVEIGMPARMMSDLLVGNIKLITSNKVTRVTAAGTTVRLDGACSSEVKVLGLGASAQALKNH